MVWSAGWLAETIVAISGAPSGGEERRSRKCVLIKVAEYASDKVAFPFVIFGARDPGVIFTYQIYRTLSGNNDFHGISEDATMTHTKYHMVNQICPQA